MAIVNDPTFTGRYQTPEKIYGVPESERDLSVGAPPSDFDWESILSGPLGYLTRPGNQDIPMMGSPGVVPGIVPGGNVPLGQIDPGVFSPAGPGWQDDAIATALSYLTRPGHQDIPMAGQPGVPSGAFPTGTVPTGIDPGVFSPAGPGWQDEVLSSIGGYLTRPGHQNIPRAGSPGVAGGSVPAGVNPAIFNPPGEGPWQAIGDAASAVGGYLTRPGSQDIPMQGAPGVAAGSVPAGTVPVGRNVALPHSADTDWGAVPGAVGGWLGDIFGGDGQEIAMSGAPGVDVGTYDPAGTYDPGAVAVAADVARQPGRTVRGGFGATQQGAPVADAVTGLGAGDGSFQQAVLDAAAGITPTRQGYGGPIQQRLSGVYGGPIQPEVQSGPRQIPQ